MTRRPLGCPEQNWCNKCQRVLPRNIAPACCTPVTTKCARCGRSGTESDPHTCGVPGRLGVVNGGLHHIAPPLSPAPPAMLGEILTSLATLRRIADSLSIHEAVNHIDMATFAVERELNARRGVS